MGINDNKVSERHVAYLAALIEQMNDRVKDIEFLIEDFKKVHNDLLVEFIGEET